MELINVVVTVLLAITGYFLKGVADTVRDTQKDHEDFKLATSVRLQDHEGRIGSLEDIR